MSLFPGPYQVVLELAPLVAAYKGTRKIFAFNV